MSADRAFNEAFFKSFDPAKFLEIVFARSNTGGAKKKAAWIRDFLEENLDRGNVWTAMIWRMPVGSAYFTVPANAVVVRVTTDSFEFCG